MECSTRNDLVLSYLRSQAAQAAAETALRAVPDPHQRREMLEAARADMLATRKALLDHCEQHGC